MTNADRQRAYRERVKARKEQLNGVAPAIIAGRWTGLTAEEAALLAYRERIKARKEQLNGVAPAIIAGLMPEKPKPRHDFRPILQAIDALFEARMISSGARIRLRTEIERLR